MKEKIRKIALLICILVFLFSGYQLINIFKTYRNIDETNKEIKQTVVEETQEKFSVDFKSLTAINSDIIGWINIEGTDISYAIAHYSDNDFYLKRDIYKSSSKAGTIFTDYQNATDFSDFNTIIYGHNMKNGSMFGTLKKYKNEDYFNEHRYIDIYQENKQLRYEIFAVRDIDVEKTFTYQINTPEQLIKQQLIDEAIVQTPYQTGVEVSADDHILTLSTCVDTSNYQYRFVVNAKLVEVIEQ